MIFLSTSKSFWTLLDLCFFLFFFNSPNGYMVDEIRGLWMVDDDRIDKEGYKMGFYG